MAAFRPTMVWISSYSLIKVESCVKRAVPLLIISKTYVEGLVKVLIVNFRLNLDSILDNQLSPGSVGFSPLLNVLLTILLHR